MRPLTRSIYKGVVELTVAVVVVVVVAVVFRCCKVLFK
jgi:hypothetical protein